MINKYSETRGFGTITRQSIRRGTFTSVTVLVKQIREYIDYWNADSKPFVWAATADDILAKVQLPPTSIKKPRRTTLS